MSVMLLVFGINVRYRPMEAATFHCPDEGGDRGYTLLEARRWFTLFFIPLIRLRVLGYVVECDSCHGRYDQRTLHLPTSATMEHKIEVAARSLFGSIAAVAHCDPDAVAASLDAYLGCPSYGGSDLMAHARIQTEAQRHESLVDAGAVMDPAGRESILMAAARAALVGGSVSDTHRGLLMEAGASLGLTPTHIEGVLLVAERSATTDEHL